MQPILWTLSGLAVELGRDRRSLARDLEGLKPDEEQGKRGRMERKWLMRRVVEHLTVRPAPNGVPGDWATQHERLAAAQADARELANAELRGELGRYSVWREELERMVVAVKSNLLALPSKLAPMLEGDLAARRAVLDQGIRDALTALATDPYGKRTKRAQRRSDRK